MKSFLDGPWGKLILPLLVAVVVAAVSWVSGSSQTSAVQTEKLSTIERRVEMVEKDSRETHDAVIEIRRDIGYIRKAIEEPRGKSGGDQ